LSTGLPLTRGWLGVMVALVALPCVVGGARRTWGRFVLALGVV
jgi:hypothetical protein